MNTALSPLSSKLSKIKIQDLINKKNKVLISINEDASIEKALELLQKYDILALPVYKWNLDKVKEFIGIISIYDILANTVFQKFFDLIDKCENSLDNLSFKTYLQVVKEEDLFFNIKVKNILGCTYESQESWVLHSSESLTNLLEMFTKNNYHRILIFDDEKFENSEKNELNETAEFYTILTQTDIINFIFSNKSNFDLSSAEYDRIFNKEIKSLMELKKKNSLTDAEDPNQVSSNSINDRGIKVVTVQEEFSALNCFKVLYLHRVSAVAVVNAKGELIANLSASDLRGMTKERMEDLLLPVFDFLEKTSSKRGIKKVRPDQIISVTDDELVTKVLDTMISKDLHRVWVVDDRDIPVGSFTQSDFLYSL
ncbi:hypothetical protein HDU92_001784, partial [Lobulomyces angularis]